MLTNICILRSTCKVFIGCLILARSTVSSSCNKIHFSRQLLVTLQGRPGSVTDSMVQSFQLSFLQAYNNVSTCGVGNFRQITSVNVTRDFVPSFGSNFNNQISTSSINQTFTWFVEVQGICQGCADAQTFQLFGSDPFAPPTAPTPFPTVLPTAPLPTVPSQPAPLPTTAPTHSPTITPFPFTPAPTTTFPPSAFPTATFSPTAHPTAPPTIICNCPAPQSAAFLQALNTRFPLPSAIDKVLNTTLLFEETATCPAQGIFQESIVISYDGVISSKCGCSNNATQEQLLAQLIQEAYNNLNALNTNGVCDDQFQTIINITYVCDVAFTSGDKYVCLGSPEQRRLQRNKQSPEQRRLKPTQAPGRPPQLYNVKKLECFPLVKPNTNNAPIKSPIKSPTSCPSRRVLNMELEEEEEEKDNGAMPNPISNVTSPIETDHNILAQQAQQRNMFEWEQIDSYQHHHHHHRRLPVVNGRCYCQANATRRQFTEDEFLQAMNSRLFVVQGAGVITGDFMAIKVNPVSTMTCTVQIKRLQSTVTVIIQTTRTLTVKEKDALGRALQSSYNTLTQTYYCDPLFRTVKAVKVIGSESVRRALTTTTTKATTASVKSINFVYVHFTVLGKCRNGCSLKTAFFAKTPKKMRNLQADVVVIDDEEEIDIEKDSSSTDHHFMTASSSSWEPPASSPRVRLPEEIIPRNSTIMSHQRILLQQTTTSCICSADPIGYRAPTAIEFQAALQQNVIQIDPSFSVSGVNEKKS